MWKTVVVVVVVLLGAALACVANYAFEDKVEKATKQRIRQYRIIAEEQALIQQILEDKMVVAKIQAQIAPQPAPPVPATPE